MFKRWLYIFIGCCALGSDSLASQCGIRNYDSDLARRLVPSVFQIFPDGVDEPTGNATIVHPDGYLITAAHSAMFEDGRTYLLRRYLGQRSRGETATEIRANLHTNGREFGSHISILKAEPEDWRKHIIAAPYVPSLRLFYDGYVPEGLYVGYDLVRRNSRIYKYNGQDLVGSQYAFRRDSGAHDGHSGALMMNHHNQGFAVVEAHLDEKFRGSDFVSRLGSFDKIRKTLDGAQEFEGIPLTQNSGMDILSKLPISAESRAILEAISQGRRERRLLEEIRRSNVSYVMDAVKVISCSFQNGLVDDSKSKTGFDEDWYRGLQQFSESNCVSPHFATEVLGRLAMMRSGTTPPGAAMIADASYCPQEFAVNRVDSNVGSKASKRALILPLDSATRLAEDTAILLRSVGPSVVPAAFAKQAELSKEIVLVSARELERTLQDVGVQKVALSRAYASAADLVLLSGGQEGRAEANMLAQRAVEKYGGSAAAFIVEAELALDDKDVPKALVSLAKAEAALDRTSNTYDAGRVASVSAHPSIVHEAALRRVNYAQQQFSTLTQINTENVDKLQVVWSQSTGTLRGHAGRPLVIKDVGGHPMMFLVSGCPNIAQCNIAQGLDLSDPDNPKQMWNYVKKTDRDESAVQRTCCDTINRGPAFSNGKLVYGTLDGFVIALDAFTGREEWVVKHARPEKGETITNVPLIAENLVVVGFSGDEFAARGRVTAYDLDTGKKVWSCQSTGSDEDVCLTKETNRANPHYGTKGSDLGIKSFPAGEFEVGGGTASGWFSYDPALKLIYYSTGSPGNSSPSFRCGGKTHDECNDGTWDNKWSSTIFARRIDTGEAAWAYQMTPFDQWKYSGANENILVDMEVDGKQRQALIHFDSNGFAYVLDRADGTLLRAHKFVTVNWAEKIDLKTGRPRKVREHSPFEVGRNTQVCPSTMGGKDKQPCSVDPKEPSKFYCPTNNWCMEDEPQERTHTQQGTVYVFANVYMYPEKPGITGKIKKFDVLTGKTEWEIPDPKANWGGTLATDGGILFYGSVGGDFRAVDRERGNIIWSRKLGSGIIGDPITYMIRGKQYVSVFAGIGGWIGLPTVAGLDMNDKFGSIGATAMAKATRIDKVPQGGMLYTFRLFE